MKFLIKLRESRGLTQNGAAVFLGISQQSYRHYETKARGAQLEFLVRLKTKFNLTWDELGRLIEKEAGRPKS